MYKKIKLISLLGLGIVCVGLLCSQRIQKNEQENNMETSFKVSDLLHNRHSGYKYDTTQVVSHEQLHLIMQAARYAPSSYNEQPWSFIICDRTVNPESYQRVFSALVEFNQRWAQNAPVLVVVVADSKSARDGQSNRYAQYDAGAAAFSMMVQATALGLMAHQMGGFDAQKISESFSIPADFMPMAVMAIGYPAEEDRNLLVEKKRKPLEENFFMGSWGKN